MKKRFLTTLCAGALAAAVAVPAIAATLSDVTPENSTDVTANIVNPGSVGYTITIPAKVDFGQLTIPENNIDNYVFKEFQVEATKLSIVSDTKVSVWMKDSFATDGKFYITQKETENPFQISYDVFSEVVDYNSISDKTPINSESSLAGQYGYRLRTFNYNEQGAVQDVTLALNQNVLYGEELSAIAGDYSGTITFHSALH